MINIAIFASGSGTNAEQLILHFRDTADFSVKCIFCNNPNARVIDRAGKLGVQTVVFNKDVFSNETFLHQLTHRGINAIVLAGFLWKMPDFLVEAFRDRMINIHPALLPRYGGKGMYGHHVHETVLKNGDRESGITIHLVNDRYDEGRILFQAKCPVDEKDSADSLAAKVHQLEHKYFPRVVEDYFRQTLLKA